ncbi:restriction endonuclease subunit S [Campylobacter sp. 2018MI35]|uniref:restriction endonuclease subunit S n=1 Tax=Campylobacter molothri TaxID=1032242 RepID=UPI001908DD8B|nr:restriction endonuclease subunit S [Campylobacter sp. 2018MI35]MBK2000723.1 restriction endonuclease subunit S [Campylobacter sp. 2018MI35]
MTNLPQGWEVKKLGDIAEISSGGTPSRSKKEYWENGAIPWVKIKDIKEKFISNTEEFITEDGLKNSSAKLFKKGTLLYSIFATLGEVAILDIDATTNQAIAGINIKDNINSLYLMYFLKSIKDEICSKGRGVAQNNLNLSILKQIEIPIPPLKEQERIVGILDESFANIDESIKNLEQDLLNLDELMQSALQKAFNPLKDKSKENYQLPQGWEWKSLGEICYITDGTHKTPQYKENGIPFLSVKNISKGFFDLSDVKYISLEEHNKLIKRAKPEFGDILICRIGTLGKAIKVCLEFEFSIFVSLGLLKPKISIISDYLVYFLNSHFIEIWINNNKVGGGTHAAKLNLSVLEKCPIAIPPLKEQEQIASYLDELSLNIKVLKENYKTQIKDYEELKKSLLKKAFEGRL